MRIGSYQVLLELASGGMGKVYLARTLGPGGVERLVAIKRAHEHLRRASDVISDRFLDEARIAAHVHHSNVVGMHQAGCDEDGYYLVLDYVEGESLNGLLRAAEDRGQRVPPQIVLRILCDALTGLHAAHEACDAQGRSLGILHRDVSTQNLLVGRDGVTRLTDFGVAKSALSRVVTDENYVQGKLGYMSPEYLRREPVSRAMDIYAMGVTAWTALAGEAPWSGAAEAQLLHSILLQGVPSLTTQAPELGARLAAVIDRACHLDPAQRFQTAREMLDALEEAADTIGGLARHVEVAEFVEALVGPELAKRWQLIQSRRDALDASDAGRPAESADDVPRAERAAGSASDTGAPTEFARRASKERRRSWLALTVALVTVALVVSVIALHERAAPSAAPLTEDVPAAPRAAPASTSQQVAAAPLAPIVVPVPSLAPETVAPPIVAAPSAPPRRSKARPAAGRRSPRAQHTSDAPQAAPFSSVNPYR